MEIGKVSGGKFLASIILSGRRSRGWAVTKKTALLDDLRHFRRHHFSQPLSPVCNLASASGGKIVRYSG